MSYLVLARKWRPQTFDDMVGQTVATRALGTALATGRIAHAFLFTGPRGVGKTTAARILAKALNCEKGPAPTPCNACTLCEEITAGRAVDVLEVDGASNTGVDDVRELRERVKYLPARGRYKVLIIDEVHMLSGSAFNALLKTLEEPPPHVVFVFATTEPHKIPATVLSRVQRYDFRRIAYGQIVERLARICAAEGVRAEPGALALVAREADGSMRDALSLLDQAWSAAEGGELREDAVAQALGVVDRRTLIGLGRALLDRDARGALALLEEVFARGHDVRHFAGALLGLLRDLAVAKVTPDGAHFDRSDQEVAEMRAMIAPHEAATVYRLFDTLARTFDEIARAPYPKLLLEMTLLKMVTAEPLRPLAEALARLEALERRLGAPGTAAPPAGAGGPTGGDRSGAAAATPAEPPQRPVVAAQLAASVAAPSPAGPAEPPQRPVVAARGALPQVGDTREVWRGILSRVAERRRALAAILEQGRVLALDGGEVRIGFTEAFLLESAREPGNLAILTEVCGERLGAGVRVSVVPLDRDAAQAPASLAEEARKRREEELEERRRALAEHPHVRAAEALLGAKLLEVRLDPMEE